MPERGLVQGQAHGWCRLLCTFLLSTLGTGVFLLASVTVTVANANAIGFITKDYTVLWAEASDTAKGKYILSPFHPVKQISVRGKWFEVQTYDRKSGWLLSEQLLRKKGCVFLAKDPEVRAKPTVNSEVVFRAVRGLMLEQRGSLDNGWLKVAHTSGEVGFVAQSNLWCNQ